MSRYEAILGQIASELVAADNGEYEHSSFGRYLDVGGPGDRCVPLWYFIYSLYYLRVPRDPARTLAGHTVRNVYEAADEQYEAELVEANRGSGYFLDGWVILGVADTSVDVSDTRGLRLRARLGDVAGILETGETVAVRFPKDVPYASYGFYTFIGDAGAPADPEDRTIRIYVNLDPRAAVAMLSLCTERLNRLTVGFGGKVLNDPARFERSDTFILFVAPSAAPVALRCVRDACTELRSKGPPPALTLEISPGVGVAEEFGRDAGSSFGQHRCALVAAGLRLAATQNTSRSRDHRLECIVSQFERSGISPRRPYCIDGSDLDWLLR